MGFSIRINRKQQLYTKKVYLILKILLTNTEIHYILIFELKKHNILCLHIKHYRERDKE